MKPPWDLWPVMFAHPLPRAFHSQMFATPPAMNEATSYGVEGGDVDDVVGSEAVPEPDLPCPSGISDLDFSFMLPIHASELPIVTDSEVCRDLGWDFVEQFD